MKNLSDFHSRISPTQKLNIPLFDDLGLELYIKRDDLLHPLVSGNKWRKLKYTLFELEKSDKKGIITFGGAFSNHLHAVAAAGKEFDFPTIGIVRGEEPKYLSSTLLSCKDMGMSLHFVSREVYKQKEEASDIQAILNQYSDFTLIPEGGANKSALKGCAELLDEIEMKFDYLCTACGTGTTLAGLISSGKTGFHLIGFPVLKGGDFIYEEVQKLLAKTTNDEPRTFELQKDYHFGGYAKHTPELLDFIRDFEKQTTIRLEQVYTGKMMFGIFDLAKNGFFKKGSKIIALHTGGLQGRLSII